ncbi:hypothetical protein [Bradyrhizobium sp. HKCCYLS3013]|uniref:hypothetical protein n=1 Tax=Bradyrhizobium sp. HKCCYLS3013 TaxID=3420735 RepID=UPI003EB8B50B
MSSRQVVFPHLSQFEAAYRIRFSAPTPSTSDLETYVRYLLLLFDEVIIAPGYVLSASIDSSLKDFLDSPFVKRLIEKKKIITYDDGAAFPRDYLHFLRGIDTKITPDSRLFSLYHSAKKQPRRLAERRSNVSEKLLSTIGQLTRRSDIGHAAAAIEYASQVTGIVETEALLIDAKRELFPKPDNVFSFLWRPYLIYDFSGDLYSYPTTAALATLGNRDVFSSNYHHKFHPNIIRAAISRLCRPSALQKFDQCPHELAIEAQAQLREGRRLKAYHRALEQITRDDTYTYENILAAERDATRELRSKSSIPQQTLLGALGPLATWQFGLPMSTATTLASATLKTLNMNGRWLQIITSGPLGDFARWMNETFD